MILRNDRNRIVTRSLCVWSATATVQLEVDQITEDNWVDIHFSEPCQIAEGRQSAKKPSIALCCLRYMTTFTRCVTPTSDKTSRRNLQLRHLKAVLLSGRNTEVNLTFAFRFDVCVVFFYSKTNLIFG